MAYKINCPICTDGLTDADTIYSTTCGHIFHNSCFEEWRRMSTSCPQCRSANPAYHKIYLTFDLDKETEEQIKKLEEEIKKLKLTLDTGVRNKELEDLKKSCTDLKKSCTDNKEKIATLTKRNEYLRAQNIGRIEKLASKSSLINNLQERVKNDTLLLSLTMRSGVDGSLDGSTKTLQHNAERKADKKPANIDCHKQKNKSCSKEPNNCNKEANIIEPNIFNGNMDFMPVEATICGNRVQILVPREHATPTASIADIVSTDNLNSNISKEKSDKNFPLFEKAKILRQYGYGFVYVHRGMLFARISKQTKPIHITSSDQINELILEKL